MITNNTFLQTETAPPTVFILGDEQPTRTAVGELVRTMKLNTEGFASLEEFLEGKRRSHPGCLVVAVTSLDGAAAGIPARLRQEGFTIPVILLTAKAPISLVVQAMQNGAVTVLEIPFEENELWNVIRKSNAIDAARRQAHKERREVLARLESLSSKEHEVLERVVAGKPNKIIAKELGVSIRTVENRRRDVYAKMQVESIVDLVKLVLKA